MASFKIIPEGEGFYTIKDVPIFQVHTNRGFNCDDLWLGDAVGNHKKYKLKGWRAPIIVGHNVKGQEKKAKGFLDNMYIKDQKMYADLVRVPREIKEDIVKNAYPSRSVEVLPKSKRILALALLGGTAPHFALPQMTYSHNAEIDEPILYFRSPKMNGFNDEQKHEIFSLMKDALQPVDGGDEQPQVYEISDAEAIEMLKTDNLPELYEAEDGTIYAMDDEGEYYVMPAFLSTMLKGGAAAGRGIATGSKAALSGIKAGSRATVKGAKVGAKAVGRGGRAAGRGIATGAGATGRGIATGGRAAGRGVIRAGAATGRAGAAAGRGVASGARGTAGFIGRHPRTAIGLGAGAAGIAAGRTSKRGRDYEMEEDGEQYEQVLVDNETGAILDYEGNEIGMAVPTTVDSTTIPALKKIQPTLNTQPGTDSATGLTNPVAGPQGELLQPVDREDSDTFGLTEEDIEAYADQMEADELQDDRDVALYNLQQEVAHLSNANALLQTGRQAENCRQYLLGKQKEGVQVGDLEQMLDFMMGLDDDQLTKYKQQLEAAPKIALGRMDIPQNFNLQGEAGSEVVEDYARNKAAYTALGVTEQDLAYAGHMRTNH